jgi:uncharacterized repeat protein (TIGR01451 family)
MSDQKKLGSVKSAEPSNFPKKIPKWLRIGGACLVGVLALFFTLTVFRGAGRAAPLAPNFNLSVDANPISNRDQSQYWLSSGDSVTYTISVVNNGDEATDTVLTTTLPTGMYYASATPVPSSPTSGDVLTWFVGPLSNGQSYEVELIVELSDPYYLAHREFEQSTEVSGRWNNQVYDRINLTRHYMVSAEIAKEHVSSIQYNQNDLEEAVAGEAVTMTVYYTIPAGTVAYSVTPRVLLQDGLWPDDAMPAWDRTFITTTSNKYPNGPLDSKAGTDSWQVEFAPMDVVTGPSMMSYVIYAHPTQYRYLEPDNEVGGDLRYHPVIRWCDGVACGYDDIEDTNAYVSDDGGTPRVGFVSPNARVDDRDFTHTFLDSTGIGAGGEQVQFDMLVKSNGPIAYNLVFTTTLGPGFSYVSSDSGAGPLGGSPLGEGSYWVDGDVTYITWTLPFTMAHNTQWSVQVIAELPATFSVGDQVYTSTAEVKSETFAGEVMDEGVYVNQSLHNLDVAGLDNAKDVWTPEGGTSPEVKIGDTVLYTVVTYVADDVIVDSPYYTDTLPEGFHYVAGSFSYEGVTVSGPFTVDGATDPLLQDIGWSMPTLDRTGDPPLFITVTYAAELTGWDVQGNPVYVNNLGNRTARNQAILYWGGSVYNELPAQLANVSVRQPNLDNNNFGTGRVDYSDGDEEVGGRVEFRIDFRNTGGVTGYDVHICDELPQGLGFFPQSTTYNPPSGCPSAQIVASPDDYQEGAVCWLFDVVCNNVDFTFSYEAEVLPSAIPDIQRTNNAHVSDYSSQPGGTNDGDLDDDDLPAGVNVDRHYSDYPDIAFPEPQQCEQGCPFTVLGLAASKRAWQDSVAPGDLITYTLAYTDTSVDNDYDGFVITDTYDVYMSYVDAVPAPDVYDAGQRLLVWDIGAVPSSGVSEILLTLQVAPVVMGQYVVTNTMMWDSNQTVPHTWHVPTPLGVATIGLGMSAPMTTHADAEVAYTVTYSNSGSSPQPITLTLDYGPYASFISYEATAGTLAQLSDNVFIDTIVDNSGEDEVLTVTLQVDAPLPYTLDHLEASVLAESPGASSKSDDVYVNLARPMLVLDKVAPVLASPVGDTMEYDIYLTNQGSYTATGIVITDTWGPNTSYDVLNHTAFGWVEPAPGATYVTRTLDLGIGETEDPNFVFRVQVDQLATFYTNTVRMTSDQTTMQMDTATAWGGSIKTTKSATPVPAFPGRVLTYTVYYTNTLNGAVLNANIVDTLPDGFVYTGHSEVGATGCQNDNWTFTPPAAGGGGDALWYCPSLERDAAGELLIWGEVKTEVEGQVLVNVTETSGDDAATRPIEEPLVTRVARPWLRVDKAVMPTHPVAPGDALIYTLTYENYGTDPAYNVIISDVLPAQVAFDSCSDGCTHSSGVVTWEFSEVPTDTVTNVTLTVLVNAGTGGETAINEDYTIRSDRLPISETITGEPVSSPILDPHLTVTKAATPTLVTGSNEVISYTVTYTNDGGGSLTGVVLTDELSDKTVFDSASPGCTGPTSGVGGTVVCTIGGLSQGQMGSVEIVVRSTSSTGWITNTAVGDSDQTLPYESEPTRVYNGACQPPYNVSFEVSENPTVGEVVTFTAHAMGPDISYAWNFGDTSTGSGQVVTHTYALSDTYTVELSVSNTCATVDVSQDVQVTGAAAIAWSPASFSASVVEGATALITETLTISNTGSATLLWTVSVTPTTTGWLSVAADGEPSTIQLPGTTAPNAQSEVMVLFDPTGLTPGTYQAYLNLSSNATNVASTDILVTLEVTAGEIYIYLPLMVRDAEF